MDVATAHVKAFEYLNALPDRNLFDAFNLGTGVGISVLEVVKKFMEVTGLELPYTIGPRRAGDVEKVFADPRKINRELGWHASYSLEQALLHAWNWEMKVRQSKE
jgi:UDP-glucose 4-epimerase